MLTLDGCANDQRARVAASPLPVTVTGSTVGRSSVTSNIVAIVV